ncbi:integral membrane protein [Purpureocillium lavendulum]|uniref:Integral membrane protein n=1 Tax=Purpureocillium lavendulum TaxID=1247861 RepID=A0AB34G955_9HYPO|nr:integral membrane protein [Purpureocillium lavendulum]
MAAAEFVDSDSDYGYDFTAEEELQLIQLATDTKPTPSPAAPPVLRRDPSVRTAIDSIPEHADGDTGHGPPQVLHCTCARRCGVHGQTAERRLASPAADPPLIADDVAYPDLSRALSDLPHSDAPPAKPPSDADSDAVDDERSPLQRFRSYPRKPLTVSDLTSGAWCELQYWYTLTRLPGGRRTRTAAMRQGSKVHQKLEDQVHTTVPIDIASKEDGFALRLWNLVQGLRTLRQTGLTRELEVWGTVDGNLVNGVIDGVSHENPNPDFEDELSSQGSQPDAKQSALTDYFPPKRKTASPKVYLTDVKTRGSLAPVSKSLLRPAKIQLLLYHRFLSDMASEKLDWFSVFRRYGLDADDNFTDAFLAQIGDLHDEVFYDAPSSPVDVGDGGSPNAAATAGGASAGSVDEKTSHHAHGPGAILGDDLIRYQTLREMVPLVRREVRLAFPEGAASLGHMLRVQYMLRSDGRMLDVHDFPVSAQALDAYLGGYMAWWRGERRARGVDIEEAFKCGTCEFAGDCEWRAAMDEERVRNARKRINGGATAAARGS